MVLTGQASNLAALLAASPALDKINQSEIKKNLERQYILELLPNGKINYAINDLMIKQSQDNYATPLENLLELR